MCYRFKREGEKTRWIQLKTVTWPLERKQNKWWPSVSTRRVPLISHDPIVTPHLVPHRWSSKHILHNVFSGLIMLYGCLRIKCWVSFSLGTPGRPRERFWRGQNRHVAKDYNIDYQWKPSSERIYTTVSAQYLNNRQPTLMMPVIQYIMPSRNKQLKKLLHFYWEVCPKYDENGKLKQEMILVVCVVMKIWYQ